MVCWVLWDSDAYFRTPGFLSDQDLEKFSKQPHWDKFIEKFPDKTTDLAKDGWEKKNNNKKLENIRVMELSNEMRCVIRIDLPEWAIIIYYGNHKGYDRILANYK